ncbi:hypothetical protein GALMADRAFT_251425 [Galerina marginata CBS 339.88]|uniref:F-box domain-containing protein n=1 Tax=Galerina marginata (strain CBS 339.88) TaxID=685588 RepID=A0A067T3P3_GALM3|nr:hypothetical protein GALMADRAFT_251425 [Galerina marginata CBS 339.88]
MSTSPNNEPHCSPMVQSKTETQVPELEDDNRLQSVQQSSLADLHPPCIASLVPIEIWCKIFGLATHIPGAYDIDDYAAIAAFARDTDGICISNRFKATMDTKLACSLVCKYWNAIIQRFLFEYIRIRSGAQACAVAEALAKIPQGEDAKDGPGKWTIRVDLALEGVHSWSSSHDEAMSRIFGCCRNLVCFSTVFSSGTFPDRPKENGLPTEVIQYLWPGQNPRLKRLEILFSGWGVLPGIEAAFGNSLEVLWIDTPRYTLRKWEGRLLFPKVRTLIATPCCGALLHQLQLPNIRACVVEDEESPISFIPNTRLVEYVSLSDSRAVFCGFDAWQNLATLSVEMEALISFDITKDFQLPSLECILIHGMEFWDLCQTIARENNDLYSNGPISRIQGNLTRIVARSSCPNLRWAKIFRPVHALRYRQSVADEGREFWTNWVRTCNAHGIRLGVSDGGAEWSGDEWKEVTHDEISVNYN